MVFLVSYPFPALKKGRVNLEKDDVQWNVEERKKRENVKIIGKKE